MEKHILFFIKFVSKVSTCKDGNINKTGKVKCFKCNTEVTNGNFCEHCGVKLKVICDC